MQGKISNVAVKVLQTVCLAVCGMAVVAGNANAQTMTEYSSETRFQLDLHVSDAVLASYFPAGWTSNATTSGPAKDCNLRAVFIDRATINGPDGKPVGKGSSRFVYLVAPVKDASGAAVQLVIGGLTEDAADAPGPFGNYLPTTTHSVQRTTSTGTGVVLNSDDWVFVAATGEHLQLHIKFQQSAANKNPLTDVKFYSAKNPAFYQISKQEQVTDVLRNVTVTPPDHVKKFSFKAGGGSYSKLFDGTEKLLSWDNIIWINRTVSLP